MANLSEEQERELEAAWERMTPQERLTWLNKVMWHLATRRKFSEAHQPTDPIVIGDEGGDE